MKHFTNQFNVAHVGRMNYGGQSSVDLPYSH